MLDIKLKNCLVVIFFLSIPSLCLGCPYFLYIKDLDLKKNVEEYTLFSYEKGSWIRIPYDIEKIDSFNQIQFDSQDKDTKEDKDKDSKIKLSSRIVIDSSLGGEKIIPIKQELDDKDKDKNKNKNKNRNKDKSDEDSVDNTDQEFYQDKQFPCQSLDEVHEIKLESNKYLYFISCSKPPLKTESLNIKQDLNYIEDKSLVSSPAYSYKHYPSNHVIFKEINVQTPDNTIKLAANNATLDVYLNIKYFFSLELKSSSIVSKLKSWYFYPTRALSDLIFYWKLLFMDIDINMGSTASFYRDAVYIPFRLNVPVEAYSYLNTGSGTIYSWNMTDIIKYDTSGKTIPIFNIKEIKDNTLVNTGLKFCGKSLCKFSLNGTGPGFVFSSYFVMERVTVEQGFFPYLVLDEAQARKDLGWDSFLNENLKNRIGIYMDISNTRKGDYYWDMWIDMKKDSSLQYSSSVCPKKISVEKLELKK